MQEVTITSFCYSLLGWKYSSLYSMVCASWPGDVKVY